MCVCERWMSDAGCQRMVLGDTFASMCTLFLCKLQRSSRSRRCSLTPSKCWRVAGLSAESDSLVAFFFSQVNCVFRIVVGLQQMHFFGPLISTRHFLRVVQPVSPHWTLQSLCCIFYFLLQRCLSVVRLFGWFELWRPLFLLICCASVVIGRPSSYLCVLGLVVHLHPAQSFFLMGGDFFWHYHPKIIEEALQPFDRIRRKNTWI